MLPNMKLTIDRRTGLNRFLASWKSADDPRLGNYTLRIDPAGSPQLILYEGQVPWFRVGHWNGIRLSDGLVFKMNQPHYYIVVESGFVPRTIRYEQERGWREFMTSPEEPCDQYGHCGAFGLCDPNNTTEFECTCLPGFEPKSHSEWNFRDGTQGCERKPGSLICSKGEGFVKLEKKSGYMAPEYAMQGLYSTKSNDFSFGVLLLEIISSRKNIECINGTQYGSCGMMEELDIVDPALCQPFSTDEVSQCIHIGLLCVREAATERPTMSDVIFMLANETTLPPPPNTPAFTFHYADSSKSSGAVSWNRVSITALEAC
ncbi:hypothetical protein FNV43_RR00132 [Rhamnella rubrinervis]|uniref:EGF-like domain-containing protein n=1 Tax=Rhamnella rubrinervis TaxID=2594499 RepID=A0A8K0HMH9_9ROSA|nr:hypothetical protein FNV43_RR00132 [Rhamnella rubrinervis]